MAEPSENQADKGERSSFANIFASSSVGKNESSLANDTPATPVDPLTVVGDSKSYVELKDRYRIYTRRALPTLDMPNAKAFLAEDTTAFDRPLFALICRTDLPIRHNQINSLRGIKMEGLLPLVEADSIFWPLLEAKTMVLIYDQPLGGHVMKQNAKGRILPHEEADFINRWARPLLMGINNLTIKGLTHRAIRPDNLLYLDAEKTKLVWGDCLSSPPAYDQPDAFETVESAMCMPEGRGIGSTANDLYAFGGTLICLSLGHCPVSHLSHQELLDLKIKKGSYGALVGEERVPLSMIELFRGLLADNPEQRWNISTTESWLEGRRASPVQFRGTRTSQRPFSFAGIDYFSYRELATAFAKTWDGVADIVRSEKLTTWVRRGFDDEITSDEITKAASSTNSTFSNKDAQDDFLVAKVCMILDKKAPIRLRGIRFMPEALGYVMATAVMQEKDIKPLIGIITTGYLEAWYDYQKDKVGRQAVRNLQQMLQKADLGMGLERCLYEISESLPCQSPMIVQEYIDDIRKVLPALDAIAKKADVRSWPIDRHICAYIATKFGGKVSDQLVAINRPKSDVATSGLLSLLAMMQWTFGPEKLYALSGWVGGLVAPIIASYHSREKQKLMEKELPKLIRKGNLADLYRFLDNKDERATDEALFEQAKQDYTDVTQEIEHLTGGREERIEYGIMLGNQIASVLSFAIAVLTMLFLLVARFLKG